MVNIKPLHTADTPLTKHRVTGIFSVMGDFTVEAAVDEEVDQSSTSGRDSG